MITIGYAIQLAMTVFPASCTWYFEPLLAVGIFIGILDLYGGYIVLGGWLPGGARGWRRWLH